MLKAERIKARFKEEQFLQENFFLKRIKNDKFSRKYFSDFIYKEYKKGDIIFKENESLDYVYFIKSGEVSTSFQKNILELNKIIHDLTKKSGIKISQSGYEIKSNIFHRSNELMQKKNIKVIQLVKLYFIVIYNGSE